MTFSHLARIEHADEREAHIPEVQQFGHSLPEGSYSRRNRDARETRIAARRRDVEQAYQLDIDAAAERAQQLGATLLRRNERWHTLADPADHPLDLCLNRPWRIYVSRPSGEFSVSVGRGFTTGPGA
jgi:Glyoxalase-like domain